jgi:hypothetical protein
MLLKYNSCITLFLCSFVKPLQGLWNGSFSRFITETKDQGIKGICPVTQGAQKAECLLQSYEAQSHRTIRVFFPISPQKMQCHVAHSYVGPGQWSMGTGQPILPSSSPVQIPAPLHELTTTVNPFLRMVPQHIGPLIKSIWI